jgi:hypothetical protein
MKKRQKNAGPATLKKGKLSEDRLGNDMAMGILTFQIVEIGALSWKPASSPKTKLGGATHERRGLFYGMMRQQC